MNASFTKVMNTKTILMYIWGMFTGAKQPEILNVIPL